MDRSLLQAMATARPVPLPRDSWVITTKPSHSPDIESAWNTVTATGVVRSLSGHDIYFNPAHDLLRDVEPLASHPNGMTSRAWAGESLKDEK